MRHVLTISDLSTAEIEGIFAISKDLKTRFEKGIREPLFPGRVMAMLFEKPSLRTRASFEAAMINLGGSAMFLGPEAGWQSREAACDFGRVLSRYVDVIVVRAFKHESVVELASHCNVPVINGLTDASHPCQVLADLYTVQELAGSLDGMRLAWVGDCNNVARSLAHICGKLGVELAVASPREYQFSDEFLAEVREQSPNAVIEMTEDPVEAVRGAFAVYADTWVSMGQEKEKETRHQAFQAYQVNGDLMQHAKDAYFLHCLPAHRGVEVTDEVMDGERSAVVDQAENRLHAQKGLLAWLLGSQTS